MRTGAGRGPVPRSERRKLTSGVRRTVARLPWILASMAGTLAPASSLQAQEVDEVRVLGVVDYIAGTDVYLAIGTEQGVLALDTLRVYDGAGESAKLLGLVYLVSATEKRSVGNVLGEPFPLERGSVLYLAVPAARLAARAAEDSASAAAGAGGPRPAEGESQRASAPSLPMEVHGRVSLDFDALRTTTRWGAGPESEVSRSFNTPTFRLQARARNMPGGFDLNAGVSLAHRTSPDSMVQPVTSTRIYQFDLEKRFEVAPVEMHLGRFYNPFEEYSGFWDGLLLRLGPEAFGAGVAVGYEPDLGDEGFSSQRPKVSGFVDFDARGEALRYSGAVSFLRIRPTDGMPDRTALGLTHRLRAGAVWIYQRLVADRDLGGSGWDVTRIELDGTVPIRGGWSASAGWRRWRSLPLWDELALLGPREDRGRLGLSYWGSAGGGSVDFGIQRPEEGDTGRTVSGSLYLTRTPVLGIGFAVNGSRWSEGGDNSLLLSPELRVPLGRGDVRGSYRFYRTATRGTRVTTHFGDLSLSFPLGSGAYLRLQGSDQWGGGLSSTRLYASLWKGF